MTETTEFVYKRTPRGLVLDPITVQVQPPTKIIHEVDEVKFLNQNPDSIGPPIETPRSYVGLEASTQMPLGNTYTLQLPIAQGNAGEVLENDGAGQLEWQPAGIGDVIYTGPTPVPTTRQFAVYDGTTGTEIKDSGYTAPAPASGIVGDVLTLNTPNEAVWTAPIVGGNVTGVPPSLPGNLPQFDNLVADQISDSGVKASEVILNPSGVPLVGGTLAQFDTGPTTITDSGITVASIGNVTGIAPTTIGNLSEWTDATGTQISNSVVVASDVVQNPSGVGVNGNLAQFGATPEQITDSGIVAADVGDVKSSTNPSVNNTAVVYDSTTGKIIKEGGVITISGDEIATTVPGFAARLNLSAGTGGGGSYGGINMNYVTSLAPPGGSSYVGIVTLGPDTGALMKIPIPSFTPGTLIGMNILNNNPSTVAASFTVPSNPGAAPSAFGIPSANWYVTFTVPSTLLVEISCQTFYAKGTGGTQPYYAYANLSSAYPAFTPLAGGGANGFLAFQMDESDDDGALFSWLLNATTLGWAVNSIQTVYIGFSTTSNTTDLEIEWGGDGTGGGGYIDARPPTIIRADVIPAFVNILP